MAEPFTLAWKYHSVNRCVIPSGGGEKGKQALVKWEPYQTKRPSDDEVNDWNEQLQPKVWAMVTGPVSGVFVVDCDTAEACGMFDLAGMPPHVRTPRGGAHYYFRYPQFKIDTRAGVLPKIDIRGEGGYVNFAGGKYDVKIIPTDDAVYPMTRLPKQILAALQNGKAKASTTRADKPIPAGERDQTLTSLAGTMRKKGMSISAMEAALLTVNQEQCDPPMPEADVVKIARSVGRYEPDAPKPKIEKVTPKLKLTMQAGIYDFSWDACVAKLSRVKESRDRTVGELKIIVTESDPVTLIQTNLNLLSGRSRREVAKELEGKSPAYDWDAILEQICTQTIELMRGGSPAIDIVVDADSTFDRPEYIVYPLIIKHMPSCIFGDPGTLKSTVALLLSQLTVSDPTDLDDKRLSISGLQPLRDIARCLYLDWETDEATATYQLARLRKGAGANYAAISYRPCALPLHADLEQICHYVIEKRADFIIIDSLAMASGGEPKETQTALQFFAALRQIKTYRNEPITSLTLAHNSKNPMEKTKSIYGSMQYTAQMRNVWEAVSSSDEGADKIDLALFHRKPPPFGKRLPPLGWRYVFNDNEETIKIERADPKKVEEFETKLSCADRILNILSGGKQSRQQLIDRLPGVKPGTIDTALSRLSQPRGDRPKVIDQWNGLWGLSYPEEEPTE